MKTRLQGPLPLIAITAILTVGLTLTLTPESQSQREDQPLPERGAVLEIDNPERALYKIAVPNLTGAPVGAAGAGIIKNDLKLVSLFEVLDGRSFIADLKKEGLDIKPPAWGAVGAQGVVKGRVRQTGQNIEVDMRFYEVAKGSTAVVSKSYRGKRGALRNFMHDFANEILRALTGKRGAFGTRLTFARRKGPGKKDVYVSSFDGKGVRRVSKGEGVSMLPSFGPGGIWFSRLTEMGMFITHSNASDKHIIDGDGLNMGPSVCGNKIYFTSTRDGNSEIYSANTDGTKVKRLTRNRAIDVSPACGPGGRIAFVSTRHGSPQIFVMNSSGGGVRRATFRGSHNQTPAWCPDPENPVLAFTGRGSGGMDIFTVNIQTQEYTRLTQGQGSNKDPAFSPDCRMVAFYSSRGGIYVSNPEGMNQNLVVKGHAETIRWSR